MKIATVKPELCVCGHEADDHDYQHRVANPGDPLMCQVGQCGCWMFNAAPAKVTEVMATVDGWPSQCHGWLGDPSKGSYLKEGGEVVLPPSQCQADFWANASDQKMNTAPAKCDYCARTDLHFHSLYQQKDLLDKKPSQPTEPLPDCPGSCTGNHPEFQDSSSGLEPGDQEEEPSPLVAVPDYLRGGITYREHPDWGKLIPLPCNPPCENETKPNSVKFHNRLAWLNDVEGGGS